MKKLIAVAAMLIVSLSAQADDMTEYGQLISLQVNTSGSDDFNIFRGILVLRASNVDTEYKWGGSTCTGKDLTPEQIALLQNVLLDSMMRVQLLTKPGQGGGICVVGFNMTHKKFATL